MIPMGRMIDRVLFFRESCTIDYAAGAERVTTDTTLGARWTNAEPGQSTERLTGNSTAYKRTLTVTVHYLSAPKGPTHLSFEGVRYRITSAVNQRGANRIMVYDCEEV